MPPGFEPTFGVAASEWRRGVVSITTCGEQPVHDTARERALAPRHGNEADIVNAER